MEENPSASEILRDTVEERVLYQVLLIVKESKDKDEIEQKIKKLIDEKQK